MAAVLGRMRSFFKRGDGNQQLPPGSYPNYSGSRETLGTITKPPYPTDDDDEDFQGVQNYNVREQTQARERFRDKFTLRSKKSNDISNQQGKTSPTRGSPVNSSNLQFQGIPGGTGPNAPPNMNRGTFPNSSSQRSSPYPSQFQSPAPTPVNNPPPFGGFPPGMNPNQPIQSQFNNPHPPSGGFVPFAPSNQSVRPPGNNTQQPSGGFIPGMPPNLSAPPQFNNSQPPSGGFIPVMPPNLSAPPQFNNSQPPSGGFIPGMPPNQSAPPQSNNPQPPSGGFIPGMPPNQSTHPQSNNPQPPSGGFTPFGAPNQSAPPSGGFIPGMTPKQTQPSPTPGMNPNQRSTSTLPNNPQSTNIGSPPTPTNSNKIQPLPPLPPPQQPSSNSGMNANQSSAPSALFNMMQNIRPPSNLLTNTQQQPLIKDTSSHPNRSNDDDNVSRIEVDYPIKDVLIDANIPSQVAIKLNEAVEKDRLGHAYHIHRYTFEPPTPQHISMGNNQHMIRHTTDNSFNGGTRHIREISNDHPNSFVDDMRHFQKPNKHHQRRHRRNSETSLGDYVEQLLYPPGSTIIHAQNSNDTRNFLNQHISNNHLIPSQQSSINSFLLNNPYPQTQPYPSNNNTNNNNNLFAGPVFYYTAQALPNDPMRVY